MYMSLVKDSLEEELDSTGLPEPSADNAVEPEEYSYN
jgi:hypothetical protein